MAIKRHITSPLNNNCDRLTERTTSDEFIGVSLQEDISGMGTLFEVKCLHWVFPSYRKLGRIFILYIGRKIKVIW